MNEYVHMFADKYFLMNWPCMDPSTGLRSGVQIIHIYHMRDKLTVRWLLKHLLFFLWTRVA